MADRRADGSQLLREALKPNQPEKTMGKRPNISVKWPSSKKQKPGNEPVQEPQVESANVNEEPQEKVEENNNVKVESQPAQEEKESPPEENQKVEPVVQKVEEPVEQPQQSTDNKNHVNKEKKESKSDDVINYIKSLENRIKENEQLLLRLHEENKKLNAQNVNKLYTTHHTVANGLQPAFGLVADTSNDYKYERPKWDQYVNAKLRLTPLK